MGSIAGDLRIVARQGEQTSTTIPGGAVDALNCGNRRGVAGTTTTTMTMTMSKRTSALAPTAATAVATMAISRRPSPKRQRIAGQSCKSRRKSSDDSAEGGDHRQRCNNDGRIQQRRRQRASFDGNALPTMTTATGSGKSGQGQMTKATDKSGWTMMASN